LYNLSRAHYEREWGKKYRKPGFGTRLLAFFLRFVPKRGLFRALAFKMPPQRGGDMYVKSVNDTVEQYKKLLQQAGSDKLKLTNLDFDTGRETWAGEYVLTDKSYARLLDQLAKKDFSTVSPDLRANILEFYHDPNAPIATKKDKKGWEKTMEQLVKLKAQTTPAEESQPSAGTTPSLR
jgi:hypothetical protein